ncbi:MAG: tetratricopeptide repeat protein [Verrucomicrobiota bacterium]
MTGEILKSGFGERKGSVSKWSLAFLAMCVAFAAVVFVFTEKQGEQLKEDIVTMMGVPELPQLEGLSPALLNALGEVYDKLRLNPADRKALEELSLLYQANGFAEKAKQGYRSLAVLEPEDALWSLRLAMLHADASDPSLELKYLDETLAKGGGTDRLLLLKAKALVRNGRPEDAEQLITSVLKSDPANRDALIEKGLMALNGEEFELAAAVFEKALQSDAGYFPLYLYLENAYGASADDRKYVAQYQQYLRTEIEHTIYYEEEQRVLGYCKDPIRLMSIAERKLKGGRWELAVKLLEAAGEADPGFSEGLGVLGRAYRMLGDDQAVIDLLSPLVSGETLDADALAELTRACLELGLIPEGVATAMKGLEIAPLSEEFYGLLGQLYLRSDARSEAEEAFRKAVELNSRDAESLAEL